MLTVMLSVYPLFAEFFLSLQGILDADAILSLGVFQAFGAILEGTDFEALAGIFDQEGTIPLIMIDYSKYLPIFEIFSLYDAISETTSCQMSGYNIGALLKLALGRALGPEKNVLERE